MAYREIRVRPVVRYIVTDYCEDGPKSPSTAWGEFDNVDRANVVAYALAEAEAAANGTPEAVVEPARKLRIDWTRGPGEPQEATRWHLSDPDAPNSPRRDRRVLITHKEIVGHMAHWAVRQHPYGRPDGLFDVVDVLCAAAQDWPVGPPSLKMRDIHGWQEIEAWLRSALHEHPVLAQWNSPRSGHTQPFVFSSRYSGPKPEDDFIDIDALLRNVALSAWREALATASEDARGDAQPVG